MPDVAKRVPIDRALWKRGIRRYGFHGLSYEYVVATLGAELPDRTIIAHLGSGASLAAVRKGKPIDTTMGFSALGGLMMGTRPGDLDPGIVMFLLQGGYNAERLATLLEERSGLLGVSARSADVAALLAVRAEDSRAAEAIELFVYQLRKHIGALAATLGGVDLLVFTGGVGEHPASIRDEVVAGIAPLRPVVRVLQTDENLMIARHTYRAI